MLVLFTAFSWLQAMPGPTAAQGPFTTRCSPQLLTHCKTPTPRAGAPHAKGREEGRNCPNQPQLWPPAPQLGCRQQVSALALPWASLALFPTQNTVPQAHRSCPEQPNDFLKYKHLRSLKNGFCKELESKQSRAALCHEQASSVFSPSPPPGAAHKLNKGSRHL